MLNDGQVIIIWRLVKQLTRQLPSTDISAPGNSPPGTIGYVTTYCSYGGPGGAYPILDDAMVVRTG